MNVLVINCGSSSLKYQLINSDTEDVLAKGLCERIGIDGRLVYQKAGLDKEITECAMPTHKEAIQFVLDALTNEKTGAIKSLKEVDAIGHRVVHGGEKFAASAVITDEMIAAVKECNDLAPLHNPANLIGIDVCSELMPGVPQVGVFDTAFHQTMPAKAYLYGLDKDNSKVIVCHLGNGSSISAVQNGKCVDTTMGLTPLEGVVMGTRSGNIDPAIVEFIAKKENLDIAGVMNVLNKKSGLQGMSGVGSDMRDIRAAIADGNEDAKNAYDVLCYGIAKFVGGYVAAMNGVDAIVFTAGIGENVGQLRKDVCNYFGYLGVEIDDKANDTFSEEIVISTPNSKVKVAVIPTNEELAICRDTVALVK